MYCGRHSCQIWKSVGRYAARQHYAELVPDDFRHFVAQEVSVLRRKLVAPVVDALVLLFGGRSCCEQAPCGLSVRTGGQWLNDRCHPGRRNAGLAPEPFFTKSLY
jgi:hypothetical protein